MSDLEEHRRNLLESRESLRECRREAQELLWELRKELDDPTLSPDERAEKEDLAFKYGQLIQDIEDDLKNAEEAFSNLHVAQNRQNTDVLMGVAGAVLLIFIVFILLVQ